MWHDLSTHKVLLSFNFWNSLYVCKYPEKLLGKYVSHLTLFIDQSLRDSLYCKRSLILTLFNYKIVFKWFLFCTVFIFTCYFNIYFRIHKLGKRNTLDINKNTSLLLLCRGSAILLCVMYLNIRTWGLLIPHLSNLRPTVFRRLLTSVTRAVLRLNLNT